MAIRLEERQQYLETYVFPNFINDSYLREHGNLTELQIENKNKVFDILRQWALGDIEFSEDFLKRYSPRSKGTTYYFKNVGNTPRLESMHDPYNYKYYGASHGRTYREFLNDYQNQNLFPVDKFSKPSITSDQIATWNFNLGKWIITYKEGKEPINKESRNIHLSRILFDDEKNDNYFTTTHINQPFLVTDIIDFQNKKNDYRVQEASEIPLTAIGNRLYFNAPDSDRSNIQTLTSESAFSNEQQVTSNVLPFEIFQATAGDPDPRGKKDDSTWNKLSQKTRDIIDGLGIDEIAPNWFMNNNVNWLLNGEITEQEFLNSYRNLVDSGVIIPFPTTPPPTPPEPTPPTPTPPTPPDDDLVSYPTITPNMVNQDFNDFQMFDNKIIGSITYKATKHFNPHYFYDFKSNTGSKLTALLIVEDEKHVSILTKENELRFSDIERDELINFDITIPNDVNFVYLKTMVYLNIDDSRPFSNLQAIELGVNRPYFEKKRDSIIGNAVGVLMGSLALTLLTTRNWYNHG